MGASQAVCRHPSCQNVDITKTGPAGELEEVIVRSPGSPPGSPLFGFHGCCPGDDMSIENAGVVQECCIGANWQEKKKSKHRLVVQESALGSRGDDSDASLSRSRLLGPHEFHRFRDCYKVGKKLGEGSFGDVYEAVTIPVDPANGQPAIDNHDGEGDIAGGSGFHERALVPDSASLGGSRAHAEIPDLSLMQRPVAVKIFQLVKGSSNGEVALAQASPRTGEDIKRRMSFDSERIMLAQLEHPHIVRMYECFHEENHLYIVLELCRGGELYKRLVNRVREAGGGGLDEPLARTLFRQMLHAVSYLHSKRIVHRDLKTENFLLLGEPDSPEADVVKLCDFGTSVFLTDRKPRSMENIGTLSYTAPEVYSNKGADIAADAWSLGVVLYVLVTGTNPFRVPGKSCREDTVKRIKSGDFEQRRSSWLNVSSDGQDLVKRLLVLDERQRLTCAQALNHPWIIRANRPVPLPSLPTPGVVVRQGWELHVSRITALLLRLPRLHAAQRAALAACALAASEAEIETPVVWRELFLDLDQDMDGRLSFDELASGLKRLLGPSGRQPSAEHLIACASALDLDQSGYIEWVEWLAVALLGSNGSLAQAEPVSTAFRLLDRPMFIADLAGRPVEITAGELISRWSPQQELLPDEVPGRLAFSELRNVLSSVEVFGGGVL